MPLRELLFLILIGLVLVVGFFIIIRRID